MIWLFQNVSDTGNDFSSIIRGLINIVQRYSTFREIETHGAGQVQMASCTTENQVCFIQSHFYSDAGHSTTEKNISAHSLKHHCTAIIWRFLIQHRTSIGNSKQALGQYISMRHFMNANLNQIHCKSFHMNYLTAVCGVRQKPEWVRGRKRADWQQQEGTPTLVCKLL